MNYPFVSLIVVNYNGKELLRRNLRSLIQTDYPHFELIIVDNASSDGSVEFVKANFPSVRIIPLDSNSGYSGAANVGAKYANGSILGLLNTDVSVKSDWLKELVSVITSKPEIGAVAPKKLSDSNPKILDGAGGQINVLLAGSDRGYLEFDRGQYDKSEPIPYPPGAAYLIRREIVSKCGYLLDPDFFMYFDDPEVGARLHLLGYTSYYVPTSIVYHERGVSRGPLNPKIVLLLQRNQIAYLYELFGIMIFIKTIPILLFFNIINSVYNAFVNKDGRYMAGLFLPLLQFVARLKSMESRRKQLQQLMKCTPQSYLKKFSGELVLTIKPNPTMLNLLVVLMRLINKYISYVKLDAPPIASIRVVNNPAEIKI